MIDDLSHTEEPTIVHDIKLELIVDLLELHLIQPKVSHRDLRRAVSEKRLQNRNIGADIRSLLPYVIGERFSASMCSDVFLDSTRFSGFFQNLTECPNLNRSALSAWKEKFVRM